MRKEAEPEYGEFTKEYEYEYQHIKSNHIVVLLLLLLLPVCNHIEKGYMKYDCWKNAHRINGNRNSIKQMPSDLHVIKLEEK